MVSLSCYVSIFFPTKSCRPSPSFLCLFLTLDFVDLLLANFVRRDKSSSAFCMVDFGLARQVIRTLCRTAPQSLSIKQLTLLHSCKSITQLCSLITNLLHMLPLMTSFSYADSSSVVYFVSHAPLPTRVPSIESPLSFLFCY